jgi:uncharacterized protein involved in response to NO
MHPPADASARVVFRLGFRPFFLAAAVFALVSLVLWGGVFFAGWRIGAVAPAAWHAHEMIYGYAVAVIAGFLLTAVRSWTGLPTPTGRALAGLLAAWLAARVLLASGPAFLAAAALADVLFGFLLLVVVARPIARTRQWRQAGIVAKLVLLAAGNLAFYAGVGGLWPRGVEIGLYGGLYLLVALIMTIGARVLPGFIERGADAPVRIGNPVWVAPASIGLFLGLVIADLFARDARLVALCAAGLAIVHGARLYAWHTPHLWRKPLLWGLYLALVSIEGGFLLLALAAWFVVPKTLALHAFAVGGVGLATLAMMARVALGHTGRDVHHPPAAVGPALALLASSAVVRVALPLLAPGQHGIAIGLAQALWVAAFALFVAVYAPILTRPRIDGAPG